MPHVSLTVPRTLAGVQVLRDIAVCEPVILNATVTDHVVVRAPSAVTHFSPGCYPNLLKRQTSVPGVFAAGDWIANEHGSFSQEKVGPRNMVEQTA